MIIRLLSMKSVIDTIQVETVRQNADPLLSVYAPARSGKLVAVTTTSSILVRGEDQ